ncbi:unnamed protein product [Rotaria socialis]|uniref:Uncharacterized protein n=1 Tax=Rotaria socialis TaxID=392032 RepID=A0A818IUL8_9BILA|nr:unnamed protein product [Rotaria socialis]
MIDCRHLTIDHDKKGFGGEHGIDERAKDKSAVGFDYKATVEKHSSQTDFVKGFGGKYGVDQNAQDKSAVGFSHKETLTKHSSQTDYTAGFGGKHGVQKEESTGSSAVVGPSSPKPPPPAEPKVVEKPAIVPTAKADVGNIRARFENMRKEQESESAKRVAEERKKRANAEQRKAQPKGDDHEKNTQHEIVVVTKESNREPSPVRPKTPTESELSTSNIPENNENNTETVTSTTNEAIEEHTEKFVGGINITSLLRPRKTSSSSSKKDDDDDDNEWAVENDENNQQADE